MGAQKAIPTLFQLYIQRRGMCVCFSCNIYLSKLVPEPGSHSASMEPKTESKQERNPKLCRESSFSVYSVR